MGFFRMTQEGASSLSILGAQMQGGGWRSIEADIMVSRLVFWRTAGDGSVIGHPETLLATEVVEPHTTPPSTTFPTHAKSVAYRRRQNKHREGRRHVTIHAFD
jgi:hypothetical protein